MACAATLAEEPRPIPLSHSSVSASEIVEVRDRSRSWASSLGYSGRSAGRDLDFPFWSANGMSGFVSRHGFRRAETNRKVLGFSPLRIARLE
jgi:hypothetical protein